MQSRGATLALIAFAVGLAIGVGVAPVTASREPPASPPPPAAIRTVHPVEVLRVIDGDTFEARVHLWPGLDITTRVRLRNIDAPEFRARCIEERDRAETARAALKAILDQGEVGIARVSLDKYGGRVLADASTAATPDVAAQLLGAGQVRRYSGARRETWCP